MSTKQKLMFNIQYLMGRIFIFFTAPLVTLIIKLAGYQVKDLNKTRTKIEHLFKVHKGPWIICANHLTLIDSFILGYAMLPAYRYLAQYRLVPWNIPEKYNYFHKNILVAMLCYLLKCIPIIRKGNREAVKESLTKCVHVIGKGESLIIFPEGTRSRSGRINTEDFPYGVGKLVCNLPESMVMCVYLRGEKQDSYSNFPQLKETFSVSIKCMRPKTPFKGLRAQRDCSRQIIEKLAGMEKMYFDVCG